MKSFRGLCAVVVSCVLLATAGIGSSGDDGAVRTGATSPQPAAGANGGANGAIQGLARDDVVTFFHRSEGIELVPLAWIKALKSIKTNRPFLDFPERFGLLPDPSDADHLPVGITASPSRGTGLLGKMVGLNCAACHVGALTFNRQSMPLLGGPALFDLNAFYQELFASLGVTLKDEGSREQFLADLAAQGDVEFAILTQQLLTAVVVVGQLSEDERKSTARLFEKGVLGIIDKVAADLAARLGGRPPDPAAIASLGKAVQAQLDDLYEKDLNGLVAVLLSGDDPGGAFGAPLAGKPDPLRAGILHQVQVALSLMKARIRFIAGLQVLHANQRPLPGPGRIDAFDGIRDLVFPRSDGIAADSPVSFPALWMVNQTYWLHWDGNTNSVIERNVGQALGQGAPFEAFGEGNWHSLVQPANIHELETVVRKLSPPEWPSPLFGRPDADKVSRGRAIYQGRCVKCHAIAPRDGHDIQDALIAAQKWAAQPEVLRGPPPAIPGSLEKLIPIEEAGTDPARAMNFATSVGRRKPLYTGGTDFAVALGDAAWNYSLTSYQDNGIPPGVWSQYDWPRELVKWQTTRCYVARPLVSIWATAPYLHNASVPTLYHLLLPAKDRPKLFAVGQREYDPVRLGYVIDPAKIPRDQVPLLFELNATAGGNLNVGHEGHDYGTDLDDGQRYDLLEFLKTL